MRGRPFEMAWQAPDTPEALKAAYQREHNPEVRTRLHGLWLLRSGWSLDKTAEAVDRHYRSVQRWVAWYREGGLPVVRDGAPGHRAEWVSDLGMPLIGLPPYSPELNPAERVFQEVRRAIEGKVYATLEDKVTAVAEYLTKLEAEPERVRSLTWWDWIKTAVQRLPVNYAA